MPDCVRVGLTLSGGALPCLPARALQCSRLAEEAGEGADEAGEEGVGSHGGSDGTRLDRDRLMQQRLMAMPVMTRPKPATRPSGRMQRSRPQLNYADLVKGVTLTASRASTGPPPACTAHRQVT